MSDRRKREGMFMMMLRKMRMFLPMVALVLTGGTQGQENPLETGGLANGRFWQRVSESARIGYVLGFRDGKLKASAKIVTRRPGLKKIILEELNKSEAAGFSPKEYKKEIDAVYAETENLNIPIVFAYEYCTLKLSGKYTKTQLEQELIQWRTVANNRSPANGQ